MFMSLFSFLLFLIFSNSLLAEVDIEFLKQKYPKCENENYRHDCFDEFSDTDSQGIGYFRNNSLWDGQYFQNDILTFEFVNGERITKSFCEEKDDGWVVCPSGNRSKAIEGGYYDSEGRGQGKFITEYSDGSKHVGEWKDNLKHGQGTMTWPDTEKYEGKWKDGKYNAKGYVLSEKYAGEFKDNNYNGQGTMTFPDGRIQEGQWRNGKYVGKK